MMKMNVTIDSALVFLVPSFWKIKVTVAASLFVIFAYWFFTYRTGDLDAADRSLSDNSDGSNDKFSEKFLSSGPSTPRGNLQPFSFGVFSHVEEKYQEIVFRDSNDDKEGKPIHKIIFFMAEAWIQKKTLSWPWRANGLEGSEARIVRAASPWLQSDQENESVNHKNVNNISNICSCGSSSICVVNTKVDVETDCLDYKILWEDLAIGEPVG